MVKPSGNRSIPRKTALLIVLLCSLFGANAVAIKATLTGVGIFTSAAIRFGGAACFLICYARITNHSLRISRHQLLQLVILTIIFFLQIGCFYTGLKHTSASHGVLIGNLLPFVVMILAHYLLEDDKINRQKTAGLILGFTGVSLLVLDIQSSEMERMLYGDGFVAMAVLLWGCNAIYVKRITASYSALQITLYPLLMAAPLHLVCGYFFDEQMVFAITPEVLAGLFYQTFVTASIGFVLWNTLIQKYGATSLHSFVFIMPISGVLCGIFLLGEPVTFALVGAIVMVTAGLIIINYYPESAPVNR